MSDPMVFSIRPQFVAMFRAGAKRFEFRTRVPWVLGETVLIYETAPTSAIVASAVVCRIADASPFSIWTDFGDLGGITREDFDRYFASRARAVAIELTNSVWLSEPRKLPDGMAAPQAWARLKGGLSSGLYADLLDAVVSEVAR